MKCLLGAAAAVLAIFSAPAAIAQSHGDRGGHGGGYSVERHGGYGGQRHDGYRNQGHGEYNYERGGHRERYVEHRPPRAYDYYYDGYGDRGRHYAPQRHGWNNRGHRW